jgi:hypothetical protein
MLRKATKRRKTLIKRRENAADCSSAKGCETVDKDKLLSEIERVENALRDKSGQFIKKELKRYLKILKRELKEKE